MRYPAIPVTEIQAPSDSSEGCRLRKVICRLAAAALRSSGAVTDIELAVGEAFSNAIKYGKRNSKITVRVVGAPGCEVSVEMAYPGSRFDTTVKRPADIEKATGGFGRYIIKQVMDDTEYSFRNGFTTLRMRKRRR